MKEQMLMESQDKTILMRKQLKCCKLFNLEYFTNKRMKISIHFGTFEWAEWLFAKYTEAK